MSAWIETHDSTLIKTSAVEAIKPSTRTLPDGDNHQIILMTANHSYVFAGWFDTFDEAAKVALRLTSAVVRASTGQKLALDTDSGKINARFID